MKNIFLFLFVLMYTALNAQTNHTLNFDGSNDYVNIPDNDLLDFGSGRPITVEFWIVRTRDIGEHIFGKRPGCDPDINYQAYSEETICGFGGSEGIGAGGDPLPLDTWAFFTGSWDGVDSIKYYLNGELRGATGGWSSIGTVNGASLRIGMSGDCPGFQGTIDEFRIWNVERTQTEIENDMWCSPDPQNEPNLIAYYNFDEGSGTTLHDQTLNNLDGTLQNFALSGTTSNWILSDYPSFSSTITADGSTTVCKPATVMLTASPESNNLTYQWKKDGETISGATNSTYEAIESGKYKCKITNDCGSATSSFIEVAINSKPKATIKPSGTVEMCEGDTTVLTANGGNNLSYQWKKDNDSILDAINQTYNATTAGKYKVVVTKTTTGCSKTSKATTINITCREDDTQLTYHDSRFLVFPNPGNGEFFIEFSTDKTQDAPVIIQLTSLTGQLLFEENMQMAEGRLQHEISLSPTLPDGIYLLQVKAHNEVYRQKIILRK